MEEADHYRCRRVFLKSCDNPERNAYAACEALANIEGIVLAAAHGEQSLHIIYSLDELTFEIIIELLEELGYLPDDSLLMSLRNTIFRYLEDNARDNMQVDDTEFDEAEIESPDMPQQDNKKYWDDYH